MVSPKDGVGTICPNAAKLRTVHERCGQTLGRTELVPAAQNVRRRQTILRPFSLCCPGQRDDDLLASQTYGISSVSVECPLLARSVSLEFGKDECPFPTHCRRWPGPLSEPGKASEVDLLGDLQGIVHFDSKVADGALQLPMTQQQLARSEVASLLVDE